MVTISQESTEKKCIKLQNKEEMWDKSTLGRTDTSPGKWLLRTRVQWALQESNVLFPFLLYSKVVLRYSEKKCNKTYVLRMVVNY